MSLLGHKTSSIFRRYNVIDDRDQREAVRNLGQADPQAATKANA